MIDYNLINKSIEYYAEKGFQRIESPWTVSKHVDNITKPSNKISYQLKHNDKCLVGSGEQSFLYLYLKGFLPKGQFQTVTPCFREENFDNLHTKYFIKNELIKTDEVNDDRLREIVKISLNFFNQYLDGYYSPKIKQTSEGYDIIYKGIELGSYGIRSCDYLDWIYATGLAEPRLSFVMNKYGISYK